MKTLYSIIVSIFLLSVANTTLIAEQNVRWNKDEPTPLPYNTIVQLINDCNFKVELKKDIPPTLEGLDLPRDNATMSSSESVSNSKIEVFMQYYNYKSLPNFPDNFDYLTLRVMIPGEDEKKDRDITISKYNKYADTLIKKFYELILEKPVSSKLLDAVNSGKEYSEYFGDVKYGSIKIKIECSDLGDKYIEYLKIDLKPEYHAYIK